MVSSALLAFWLVVVPLLLLLHGEPHVVPPVPPMTAVQYYSLLLATTLQQYLYCLPTPRMRPAPLFPPPAVVAAADDDALDAEDYKMVVVVLEMILTRLVWLSPHNNFLTSHWPLQLPRSNHVKECHLRGHRNDYCYCYPHHIP